MILIINNQEIPIAPLTKCEVQKTSPLTSMEQIGEYALSFEVPVSPILQKEMGFSNLPNILSPQKTVNGIVMDSSFMLFSGNIAAQEYSKKLYSLELTAAPGNIPITLWNTKLNELDLGRDTIATTSVNTQFYKINIYDLIGTRTDNSNKYTFDDYIASNYTTFELYINTVKVFEYVFNISSSGYYEGIDFVEKMIDSFNNNPPSAYLGAKIERFESEWVIQVPDGNYTVQAKIIVNPIPSGGNGRPRPGSTTSFTITYPFTRISYQSIGTYFNTSLTNLWNKPYELPMIYAPNFYGENNNNFNGYINLKQGTSYKYCSDTELNTYTFCPAFKIQWVMYTICSALGYTLDVSFFNNSVWKDALWITLVATDKQLPTTSKPFNIHNNIIEYKDYMPQWTIKEFLENIQNWLNIMIDFNSFSKVVTIRNRTVNLSTGKRMVIDDYLEDNPKIKPTIQKKYSVKYNISTSDDPSLINTKFADITPADTEDITDVTIAFTPMILQSEYSEVENTNIRRINPANSYNSSWDWSSSQNSNTLVNPNEPSGTMSCYEKGSTPMFLKTNEKQELPKSRVLFYTNVAGNQTLSNTKDGKSLFIAGDNGLYKLNWEAYTKMFDNTIEVEQKTILPKTLLYQIDWDTILVAHNMAWVAHKKSIDPDSDIALLTLWRINP